MVHICRVVFETSRPLFDQEYHYPRTKMVERSDGNVRKPADGQGAYSHVNVRLPFPDYIKQRLTESQGILKAPCPTPGQLLSSHP